MNLAGKLRDDELLSRVVRNSAHLFSSNSISLILSVVQSVLAARMLGPTAFGLVAIVMSYASTVNGLLSFRMSELVVRYGGQYLEQGEKRKAAALIKIASRAEAAVSFAAFVVVAASAGIGSHFFAKMPGTAWMFIVYAVGLLANFNAETATGILQITDRIRARGTINLVQNAVCALAIVGIFVLNARGPLGAAAATSGVLIAYLLGKTILGLGLFQVARAQITRRLGQGWLNADPTLLPPFRELFGFVFSSNLSATAILVFRESELLWVGLFLNSGAAGLYKIAYTIVNFLSVPADPLILSVYPETNRLIVQEQWGRLKQFLRRVTLLSLAYNLVLALGLVLLGRWVLAVFGSQYVPAYPALLALLVGLVFNYTLFWNRPLLLSLGLQAFALYAILAAGVLKLTLAVALVPRFGYVMEATLLSAYYVLSVGLMVWRGLKEVNHRQTLGPAVTGRVPAV
jgi:O-antigen/teichoic acid export membrane protein